MVLSSTFWRDVNGYATPRLMLLVPLLTAAGCNGDENGAAGQTQQVQEEQSRTFDRLQRARDFLDKGDNRAALIELKNVLQQDPEAVGARWLLGNLYLQIGDGKGAIKELERAVELGLPREDALEVMALAYLSARQYRELLAKIDVPPDGEAPRRAALLTRRGDAHFGLDQADLAELAYTRALEAQPDFSDAQTGMARLSLTIGDVSGAGRWLESALQSDPTNAAAWTFKGRYARGVGEAAESESAYAKALEYAPTNLAARLGYIEMLLANGKYDQAENELGKISERLRRLPRVAFLRGALAYGRNDYEAAAADIEFYLNANPNDGGALYLFAASLYRLGHFERSEQAAANSLALIPHSREAMRLLAALKVRDGRSADNELAPLLAADPDNSLLLYLKAQNVRISGDTQREIKLLKQVSALEPQSPQLLASIGETLLARGETESGIQALQSSGDLLPEDLETQLKLAAGYTTAGDHDRAIELLTKLQASHPEEPAVWLVTGVAHSASGDTERAESAFKQALGVAPGYPLAAHNLAEIELKLNKDPEAARAYYKQVLEYDPDHIHTLLALAALAEGLGNRAEQIARLEEAIAAHPDAVVPLVQLAQIQLKAGDPELALVTLQGVANAGRRDETYLQTLGGVHLAVGDAAQAVGDYKALTEIRPDSGPYFYALADAYGRLGRPEEMREALLEALTLQPDQPAAARIMTELVTLAPNPEKAWETVQALEAAAPDHPHLPVLEGRGALRSGRTEEAIAIYRAARERFPENPAFVRGMAAAQLANGNPTGAITTLLPRVEPTPADLAARRILASAYTATDRRDAARAQYVAIIAEVPDDAQALNNLAWLLLEEEPAAALGHAERAAELLPEDPRILDTLGLAQLANEKSGQAVETLERAVSAAPDNADIRLHLARALSRDGQAEQAKSLLRQLVGSEKAILVRDKAQTLLNELGGG